MDERVVAGYARDLGFLVRELAVRARREWEEGRQGEDARYLAGRLSALHEIVSLMQDQAVAFGIDLEDVALDGFDADRDLL